MGTKRLFTAIDISSDVRENAGRVQDQLAEELGGIRWVDSEQMHVTLKYLGSVPEERMEQAKDILRTCAREHEPFQLRYQGIGQFPERGTPRVLWMGVEESSGGDQMTSCYSFLDEEMTEVGVDRDDRSFHAHLTLGRVKQEEQLGDVRSAFEREQHTTLGEDHVEELVLFESERHPDGARYTALETVTL